MKVEMRWLRSYVRKDDRSIADMEHGVPKYYSLQFRYLKETCSDGEEKWERWSDWDDVEVKDTDDGSCGRH
jgi:hypothetical protein